ncbi:hypothetical protein JQN72_11595 [Phycicoccus sp. CSK15P-2]|uniref:hypothetical protein n=1 Tax=Phycicoccus sp. CSK15P-2 TaxID=2807627 RepID=UPI00194F8672|nr:hypothetical protein [Phycicoccus sp. CSK15P-2]MBM6404885.1 hypothetical protein [Phycicoccus sp. CSK15P-2]
MTPPATMRAVALTRHGGPEVLEARRAPLEEAARAPEELETRRHVGGLVLVP